MVANLGMDFASIQSKEYADAAARRRQRSPNFANKPIGTGPFQFVDYQTDAVIRYQAFADYWKGKVAIDDLIFAITTDTTVRAQKLKAGECDIMSYPNAQPTSSPAGRSEPAGPRPGRPQHRLPGLQHDHAPMDKA
jgi:dipeptide transport system substrate-binding protein